MTTPAHTIRLRGGWIVEIPVPSPDGSPRRLDLPTRWPGPPAAPCRLIRRFGRPPIDPARQWIELRIRDAPGLSEVRLNGAALSRSDPGAEPAASLSIRLPDSLPSRNELVLIATPPDPDLTPAPWGDIALVIHPAAASVAGP